MEYEENNKSNRNNNNNEDEEEDPRMKVNEKTFNWVDRNKDGDLTLYELVAAAMNKTMLSLSRYRITREFASIDGKMIVIIIIIITTIILSILSN